MIKAYKETFVRLLLGTVAWSSLLFLGLIMAFLFMEGVPAFKEIGVGGFIFGKNWYPTATPPEFQILPMVVGSVVVSLVASCLAIPLGVMTAVWLTEVAAAVLRRIIKPVIELLAALPSVVIGFFGMIMLAPVLQDWFDADSGLNLLNAGIMLAFMSVPTICSVAEDALFGVPQSLREASLALGATRWETTVKVVIPAAFSGISTACMLGISRSMGETMVVLMVAGGAGIIPESLFEPVRPMPSAIAAEIAEASFRGDHYHALFAIGIVLFLFTLTFNLVAQMISLKKARV